MTVVARQLEMQRKLAQESLTAWEAAKTERKRQIGDIASKIKAALESAHSMIRDDETAADGVDPAKRLGQARKLLVRAEKLERKKASETKRLDGIIEERYIAMRDALFSEQLPLLLGDTSLVTSLTVGGHILRVGMRVMYSKREHEVAGFKTVKNVEHVVLMDPKGKRRNVIADDIESIHADDVPSNAPPETPTSVGGFKVGDVVKSALLKTHGTVTSISPAAGRVGVLFTDETDPRDVAVDSIKKVDPTPLDVAQRKLSLGDTVEIVDTEHSGMIEAFESQAHGGLVYTHAKVRVNGVLVVYRLTDVRKPVKRGKKKAAKKRSKKG